MKARIGPTSAQRKTMNSEIRKQIESYTVNLATELDAVVLWLLHEQYGFGEKRLKHFYETFLTEVEILAKRYDVNCSDAPWLCAQKLKGIGIEFEKWGK